MSTCTPSFVCAWRVDRWPRRLKAARRGDRWTSDVFAWFEPELDRPLRFQLELWPCGPADGEKYAMFAVRLLDKLEDDAPPPAFRFEIWIENKERRVVIRSERTYSLASNVLNYRRLRLCTHRQLETLNPTSTIFFCCRLPRAAEVVERALLALPTDHYWRIDEFGARFDRTTAGEKWTSDPFFLRDFGNARFQLAFHPKTPQLDEGEQDEEEEASDWCSVFLELVDLAGHSSIAARFRLVLMDRRGNERPFGHPEITHSFQWPNEERGWPHFARQLEIASFVGQGDLFVRCEVREAVGLSRLGRKRAAVAHAVDAAETTGQLKGGETVEIRTNGRNFNVSRDLLCAHSPIFRRILTAAKRKRPDRKHVVLPLADLDADLAERVFHFLQTGKVRGLSEVAGRLLLVALKYGIQELKDVCVAHLVENMTPQNVLESLRLVCGLEGPELDAFRNHVFEFAAAHIRELKAEPEWAPFRDENPTIVIDILERATR